MAKEKDREDQLVEVGEKSVQNIKRKKIQVRPNAEIGWKERIKKELQKHKVKIMEEGVWIDVGMSKPWEHEADSSFY